MHRFMLGVVATALVALSSSGARAGSVLYFTSNGAFTTALGTYGYSVDNILFNQPGSITQGNTVLGFTQGGVGLAVNNTATVLKVNNAQGGQATVGTLSGAAFDYANINPVDTPSPPNTGSFLAVSFNAATLNQSGTLTLTGTGTNLDSPISFQTSNQNGQNFFGVIAIGGAQITGLTITADGATGGLVEINNLGQFRVSPGITAVPEPGTMGMAAMASLFGLGFAWRRRRAPLS